MACLHEAIVAAIGRATDRRDDRLVCKHRVTDVNAIYCLMLLSFLWFELIRLRALSVSYACCHLANSVVSVCIQCTVAHRRQLRGYRGTCPPIYYLTVHQGLKWAGSHRVADRCQDFPPPDSSPHGRFAPWTWDETSIDDCWLLASSSAEPQRLKSIKMKVLVFKMSAWPV